jgi:hypothetical protein
MSFSSPAERENEGGCAQKAELAIAHRQESTCLSATYCHRSIRVRQRFTSPRRNRSLRRH